MVTKENQIKFFTEELKELEFSVKRIFNSNGWYLFQNGELYVGQYRGVDENRGNVFIDIPFGPQFHSPRLDLKLTCFTLKRGYERPSKWNNITYLDLLKDRNRTDSRIVDYIPSMREGWITIIVRELESDFIENLQYNQLLGFGPIIPPFEYLENLRKFSISVIENDNSLYNKILSFRYPLNTSRKPKPLIEREDIVQSIIHDVNKSGIYILQGPPGTGKTFQIADLVSRLVLDNKSVLITALTNRACIEVCEKSFFNKLFKQNRVSKLPTSTDEKKKFPKLCTEKEIVPIKGHLTLTTFYKFSSIWQEQTKSFDYIIVEEASQAYLTTIAAATKVAKNVIVVGDPKQIVPIVTNKKYKNFQNIDELINGMDTMCSIDNFTFSRKVETRRLTERSTKFTNCFYQGTIKSKALYKDISNDISKLNSIKRYIHSNGGPSLIMFSNNSKNINEIMLNFLRNSIEDLSILENNSLAILTPYIETLTYLQQNLRTKTQAKKYIIETVDRVQGLDVDYCFIVIPRSTSFSFNLNRFNVATSRAKKSTFILVEENFDKLLKIPLEVSNYLSTLKKEFSFLIT